MVFTVVYQFLLIALENRLVTTISIGLGNKLKLVNLL